MAQLEIECSINNTTLPSASIIGTPTAFSTAIKQPPSLDHNTNIESSFFTDNLMQGLEHSLGPGIAGRLSLESEALTKKPTSNETRSDSQVDSSSDILDLDKLPNISCTQFLTSPSHSKTVPNTPVSHSVVTMETLGSNGFVLHYSGSQSQTGNISGWSHKETDITKESHDLDTDSVLVSVLKEENTETQTYNEGGHQVETGLLSELPSEFFQQTRSSSSSHSSTPTPNSIKEEEIRSIGENNKFAIAQKPVDSCVTNFIFDEPEPSLLQEAAEFSLFEPSQLSLVRPSIMSTLPSSKSTNNKERSVREKRVSWNMSDKEDDSLRHHSIEFVEEQTGDMMSKEKEATEQREPTVDLLPYLVPTSPVDPTLATTDYGDLTAETIQQSTFKIQNPFDSECGSDQSFDQYDFEIQDKESFLDELQKEEDRATLFAQMTPSSLQSTFTLLSADNSHMINQEGQDVSISTYFQGKSFPLGSDLASDPKTMSEQRPQFAENQIIISPVGLPVESPAQISIDTTPKPVKLVSLTNATSLTPVIPKQSPDVNNLDIPQLDLVNISTSTTESFLLQPTTQPSIFASTQQTQEQTVQSKLLDNAPPTNLSIPTDNLPSFYFRNSVGSTDESTLQISELSCFPFTPAPSRLQTGFNVTGMSVLPTPSVAHDVTRLFDLTEETCNTLTDVSSLELTSANSDHSHNGVDLRQSSDKKETNICTSPIEDADFKRPSLQDEGMKPVLNASTVTSLNYTGTVEDTVQAFSALNDLPVEEDNVAGYSLYPSQPSSPPPPPTPVHDSPPPPFTPQSILPPSVSLSSPSPSPPPSDGYSSSASSSPALSPSPPPELQSPSSPNHPPSIPSPLTKSATKLAQIKATLDATRFDVESFLSTLKSSSSQITPPTGHTPLSLSHSVSVSSNILQKVDTTPSHELSLQPSPEKDTSFSRVVGPLSSHSDPSQNIPVTGPSSQIVLVSDPISPHVSSPDPLSPHMSASDPLPQLVSLDVPISDPSSAHEHVPDNQSLTCQVHSSVPSSSLIPLSDPPSSSLIPLSDPPSSKIHVPDSPPLNATTISVPIVSKPTVTHIPVVPTISQSFIPQVDSTLVNPTTVDNKVITSSSHFIVRDTTLQVKDNSPSQTSEDDTPHSSPPMGLEGSPQIPKVQSVDTLKVTSLRYTPLYTGTPQETTDHSAVNLKRESSSDSSISHLLTKSTDKSLAQGLPLNLDKNGSVHNHTPSIAHLFNKPVHLLSASVNDSLLDHTHTSFCDLPPVQLSPTTLTFPTTTSLPTSHDLVEVEAPETVLFEGVCCVGSVQQIGFHLRNLSSRWIQGFVQLTQLYCDGIEVAIKDCKIFTFLSKCFIGPGKTEQIKVSFSPDKAGSYRAILQLLSLNKTSLATITLLATSEHPHVQFLTSGDDNIVSLDFGVVFSGKRAVLPLYVMNHGQSNVPLRLSLATKTQYWYYYSLTAVSEALISSQDMLKQVDKPVSNSSTLSIVLPAKPVMQVESPVYTIMVEFNPSNKSLNYTGSAEKCSSQIEVFVDGPHCGANLCAIPVEAMVGVARLCVPRSMQELQLSCQVGSCTSVSLPVKNGGNLPMTVRMEIPGEEESYISIHPPVISLQPSEKSHIQVIFKPLSNNSADYARDKYLMMHIESSGPSYQIKLNTDINTVTEQISTLCQLECNKQVLFWDGASLEQRSSNDVIIRNNDSRPVMLELTILDENTNFQFETTPPTNRGQIRLDPHTQLTVTVHFLPALLDTFYQGALNIVDIEHVKKYKISLFGYGGSCDVIPLNCPLTQDGLLVTNLGNIIMGQRNVAELKVANKGQRSAFVKAIGLSVDNVPLPTSKLNIIPNELILQPQQTKELLVIYHCGKNDTSFLHSSTTSVPIAKLLLYTGDEILRRLLRGSPTGSVKESKDCSLIELLLKPFPDEENVTFDLPVILDVLDCNKILDSHMKSLTVTLLGSTVTAPTSQSSLITPSHTHVTPANPHTTPSLSPMLVTPKQTLKFPDIPVKHFTEKLLEINNPYSVKIQWKITSSAPPFVKEVDEDSDTIFKTKYSVFWIHQCTGQLEPYEKTTILVTFQPQDVGVYSQIWNLQVTGEGLGMMEHRISFGGKAILTPPTLPYNTTDSPFSVGSTPFYPFVLPHSRVPLSVCHTHSNPSLKNLPSTLTQLPWQQLPKSVYLSTECVEFPCTAVGQQAMIKIRVINKDIIAHQFNVIKPHPPFSVVHHQFELTPRHCARLPVYFIPTLSGCYQGILAIRTTLGHQMFTLLKGSS